MDKDIEERDDRDPSLAKRKEMSVPEPVDDESFRHALGLVLAAARANQVAIGHRSWKCDPASVDRTWDVEIIRLEPGRPD